ncbi:MAG: hypothetical protein IPH07_04125 [Deltaproteobacteria bacterium]|nr:hypothetical protein [Deltaproteobacteria bacterium]MBK8237807.1 hypothetical protein [Deltaproteobacteria bacterium]MBP7289748.1 hypothetical protein [Nannocystaceae bacterium]
MQRNPSVRTILHATFVALVPTTSACQAGAAGSTSDGTTAVDSSTTAVGEDDGTTANSGAHESGDGSTGSSTTATTEATQGGSDDGSGTTAAADTGPADDSSSGEPANDCSNPEAPCALELGLTATAGGGVDRYYTYVVGAGDEHVEFTCPAFGYASWLDAPWAFGCNARGPCCLGDGANTCDKPLAQVGLALGPGDTAYVFVTADAPYELTITGG